MANTDNGKRKLIFLDIDGTLTEPGCNIPPESAVKAIKKAQEKGHLVFLCTGRNYNMLAPLIPYGFDGIVGSSGGYVTVQGNLIHDQHLSDEQRDEILAILKKNNVFFTLEGKDGSYTDEGFGKFLEEHATDGANSELLRWRRQIESNLGIKPMSEYTGEAAYKVIFMCLSIDNLKEPLKAFEGKYSVVVQEPDQYGLINGELVSLGLDKGNAIRRVAEYLGTDMADTVGYGDSMNDLEMIQVVGHSVCMANGAETLKKISDEVCPAVAEDGLYKSFLAHGWIEE